LFAASKRLWARAGLFSYLTFKFLNPLLNAGYESPLQEEDLYDLPLENTPAHNFKVLEKAWALEPQPDDQGEGGAFLWRVVMRMIWKPFFLSGILQMVQLIETGEAGDAWLGYLIAAAMLTASIFQTGFDVHYNYQMNVLGLRVRGGMMGKVFKKATRLSEPAFQRVGVGKIVNLVQIDCMKFSWALWCVHALWAMPIMLIVAISLLCDMLGAAGFVGLIIMVLMMPVNMRIMQGQFKYQKRITERRDERVELLTELLQGMKLIKLLGWEQQMADKLDEKRQEELQAIRTKVFLEAGSTIMWVGLPVFVNVATFTVYVLLGNELTATKAFTSLALFEVLQFPLTAFPRIVQAVLELQVSIKRLTHFFELPGAQRESSRLCFALSPCKPCTVA
jgi:ATP-binding cassette subfamily C (CFTR/MRP) protein 1